LHPPTQNPRILDDRISFSLSSPSASSLTSPNAVSRRRFRSASASRSGPRTSEGQAEAVCGSSTISDGCGPFCTVCVTSLTAGPHGIWSNDRASNGGIGASCIAFNDTPTTRALSSDHSVFGLGGRKTCEAQHVHPEFSFLVSSIFRDHGGGDEFAPSLVSLNIVASILVRSAAATKNRGFISNSKKCGPNSSPPHTQTLSKPKPL